MGFPIRDNIFKTGSIVQRYFARFPIQVAILHSPTDYSFTEHLKTHFAEFDRNTGKNLVFLAVLDPPEEWLQDRDLRGWWIQYQQIMGASSFTVDDKVLVKEIGRLFGLNWRSFPAIVASTNLWNAEYVSCSTSSSQLDEQLKELTKLADNYRRPNIYDITSVLEAMDNKLLRHHPPNETTRQRLNDFYDIIFTLDPYHGFKDAEFKYLVRRQLDAVNYDLETMRRIGKSEPSYVEGFDKDKQERRDTLIENISGRLVAPASVAARLPHALHRTVDLPGLLDEEAVVMIETAAKVGALLENIFENPNTLDPDFTPGAQGVWKAFELEVNLSVIQAARLARDIAMPKYFSLFDPNLSLERGVVQTGQRGNSSIKININQRDWEDCASLRHRFITLGNALYVIRSMLAEPTEKLDAIIQRVLGEPLPHNLFEEWNAILRIRNRASHIHSIDRNNYEKVWFTVLAPEIIGPLLRIKDSIKQGRLGIEANV